MFVTNVRGTDNESMLNGGDQALEVRGVEQKIKDDDDGKVVAGEGTDDSENKQGGEDEEEDQEAAVRKQMERYHYCCAFAYLKSYILLYGSVNS